MSATTEQKYTVTLELIGDRTVDFEIPLRDVVLFLNETWENRFKLLQKENEALRGRLKEVLSKAVKA